jgi:hypothetical protein
LFGDASGSSSGEVTPGDTSAPEGPEPLGVDARSGRSSLFGVAVRGLSGDWICTPSDEEELQLLMSDESLLLSEKRARKLRSADNRYGGCATAGSSTPCEVASTASPGKRTPASCPSTSPASSSVAERSAVEDRATCSPGRGAPCTSSSSMSSSVRSNCRRDARGRGEWRRRREGTVRSGDLGGEFFARRSSASRACCLAWRSTEKDDGVPFRFRCDRRDREGDEDRRGVASAPEGETF